MGQLVPETMSEVEPLACIKELRKKLSGFTPADRREQSEEDIKKDFLMPLFTALGWDTANRKVKDEVVAERHIGNRKRIDYGFRLKSVTRFYVEAKDLKDDLESEEILEQAANYSYLKGVPWAVVSNFEKTIILEADSEVKTPRDRIYLNFSECDYERRMSQLKLLSREATEEGALDRDAEEHGKKPRRKPIDEQLLGDLTSFRNALTREILRLNRARFEQDSRLLDETVQRFLDRLLFIRNAEDRHLEERELLALVHDEKRESLTSRLQALFRSYDDRYDSELFEKTDVDDVRVDWEVLDRIIRGLYSTPGRTVVYDFAVIGADVLGEVYEQYLGMLLKRTPARSSLVNGSGHRKEQGIYYTPAYVVQHLVEATVGEVLRQGEEKRIRNLRIVDPACGSGTFLLKSYEMLESHWRKNHPGGLEQSVLADEGGEVAFSKRVEILQSNIFGIDLDRKAAEIARLNLLLRISERRKRLPLLRRNIRIGNSLVSDSTMILDPVEKESAFDWSKGFPMVAEGGGFDVVIGNPPWSSKIPSETNVALAKKWGLQPRNVNICTLFVLQGLSLVKNGGYFGFLLPKVIIKNEAYEPIRRKLLTEFDLERVIDFGQFPGVASDAVGIIARRTQPGKQTRVFDLDGRVLEEREAIRHSTFTKSPGAVFALGATGAANRVLEKVKEESCPIDELFDIARGIELGQKSALLPCPKCQTYNETGTKYYGPSERQCRACGERLPKTVGTTLCISSSTKVGPYQQTAVAGRQLQKYQIVDRYFIAWPLKGVDYKEDSFQGPMILLKRIATRPIGTFVPARQLCFNTVYSLRPKSDTEAKLLLPILGLLNSKLMAYYFEKTYNIGMALTTQVTIDALSKLPIRRFEGKTRQALEDQTRGLVRLGEELASLCPNEVDRRHTIEEKIEQGDKTLDELVFRTYGLTRSDRNLVLLETRREEKTEKHNS
jgi:type I restriction-modification system DNA methylase subunit